MDTTNPLVDGAPSQSPATDAAESTEPKATEPTATPDDKQFSKDDFYREYGQRKKLEKEVATLKEQMTQRKSASDVDYDEYDADQLKFLREEARKEAREEMKSARQQELEEKEEKAFFDSNPQAYHYQDDIAAYRKVMPKASYQQAYNIMRLSKGESITPAPKEKVINDASISSKPVKDVSGAEDDIDAVNKAFAKLMGR